MKTFDHQCRLYLQLHARKARLDERMKPLRETIVAGLQSGEASPKDLPFLLILRKRMRTLSDWKEALKRELKVWLGKDDLVDARMVGIQAGFPTEETEALYVEINKAYQAKIETKRTA